ncbi:MAG TPA: tetraacyldisaccharide 4'-kinase [Gemmatimonadales bacterium]|nr:tetraacyldisaccharide 4'-kinase [Gemmatimonadales bacterium]
MRGLMPRLWAARGGAARAARLALAPAATAYGAVVTARRRAYAAGWLATRALPLPSVAVGNLAVGGAGKTPLAGWIARRFLTHGLTPGILLRGYGADEGHVHRAAVPEAIVVEDPDRRRGARHAGAAGADVLVLDDAFQRLDVRRDLDLVLLAAESLAAPRRLLPAGPWREPRAALRHADFVIVTRKAVPASEAARVADSVAADTDAPVAIAHLALGTFTGLHSGRVLAPTALAGARVLAAAGIADPDGFATQLTALGAHVTVLRRPDHHRWTAADVEVLLHVRQKLDYVVVTAKDAAKLRRVWPAAAAEPIVASLDVRWDRGEGLLTAALAQLVPARRPDHLDMDAKGYGVGADRRIP